MTDVLVYILVSKAILGSMPRRDVKLKYINIRICWLYRVAGEGLTVEPRNEVTLAGWLYKVLN